MIKSTRPKKSEISQRFQQDSLDTRTKLYSVGHNISNKKIILQRSALIEDNIREEKKIKSISRRRVILRILWLSVLIIMPFAYFRLCNTDIYFKNAKLSESRIEESLNQEINNLSLYRFLPIKLSSKNIETNILKLYPELRTVKIKNSFLKRRVEVNLDYQNSVLIWQTKGGRAFISSDGTIITSPNDSSTSGVEQIVVNDESNLDLKPGTKINPYKVEWILKFTESMSKNNSDLILPDYSINIPVNFQKDIEISVKPGQLSSLNMNNVIILVNQEEDPYASAGAILKTVQYLKNDNIQDGISVTRIDARDPSRITYK
jgi:hypothetical protein